MAIQTFKHRPGAAAVSLAMLAVAVLMAVAALSLLVTHPAKASSWRLLEIGFMLVAIFSASWFHWRLATTARLVLDERGIRMQADLPRWSSALVDANWQVRWQEITKVSVIAVAGAVRIHRAGARLPRALRFYDWIPEAGPGAPIARRGVLQRPDYRATELWQALERRGLFDPATRQDDLPVNFDLAAHSATRAAMVAMGLLAAYWALDGFLTPERWAGWNARYLLPHAAIGALGALVAFACLVQVKEPRKVPPGVAGGLALLIAPCVALASWTALIRVNQVAGGPLEPHAYVRNASCDALEPVEAGLPVIEYTDEARNYWCSFPPGRQHTVLVRRGLAGLYQVDLTEHTRAIRAWHPR